MNDLVSIIMPAFNAEKTIVQSIESVSHQTYHHWELIIINDGSSDNTETLIQHWVEKDSRIKYYPNASNQGVSYSRNRGMSLAKGEWIAFLDSDDLWVSHKLEIQLHQMQKSNHQFSFTGVTFIDEEGHPYHGNMEVKERLHYKHLLKHNSISCSSVIMHSSLIKYASFEGDQMSEDYASWLNILKELKECVGINQPLLIYRMSKNSKSGNKFKSALMGYRAFRHHGLNPILSLTYLMHHLLNSLIKYSKIKPI